jgi:hypothetical protein
MGMDFWTSKISVSFICGRSGIVAGGAAGRFAPQTIGSGFDETASLPMPFLLLAEMRGLANGNEIFGR